MVFAPDGVTAFRYLAARFDPRSGVAEFDFELLGPTVREPFTERLVFEVAGRLDPGSAERVDRLVAVLGAVLGLSYYKAAAPPRIEIEVPGITAAAVRYLRFAIRAGLAEFAYRAGLPALLDPEIVVADEAAPLDRILVPDGAPLVPIGGGKDSVVTIESLRAASIDPVQFAVSPNAIVRRVAEAARLPLVAVERRLDPRLLELNAEGALNGHVPVTAMNSLAALIQARLLGLGPVVLSNESSASDPTLFWDGDPVNHQWSKSLEAERALAAMLREQAGLDAACFSLLRPFSELRIARAFARTVGYDAAIVSCNRAFRRSAATPGWCGDCDKCRFVFLVFAAAMDPDRVVGIVGRDLFADAGQLDGFRTLVGLGAHKPFECVGEEAESSVALAQVARISRWASSPVVRALVAAEPAFGTGDPGVERRVMGDAEADPLPGAYQEARYALV